MVWLKRLISRIVAGIRNRRKLSVSVSPSIISNAATLLLRSRPSQVLSSYRLYDAFLKRSPELVLLR